jgi:hypothetical protein|eukprot:Stramenopile-MAST_4_protein_1398
MEVKSTSNVHEGVGAHSFCLQCRKCNTILAESRSYMNVDFDVGYSSFKSAKNVCKDLTRKISSDSHDTGAFYYDMKCRSCFEIVGRIYEEVPLPLVELRLAFNFENRKTRYFRLGEVCISQVDDIPDAPGSDEIALSHPGLPEPEVKKVFPASDNASQQGSSFGKDGSDPVWKDELFKLQTVILDMNARLTRMESHIVETQSV